MLLTSVKCCIISLIVATELTPFIGWIAQIIIDSTLDLFYALYSCCLSHKNCRSVIPLLILLVLLIGSFGSSIASERFLVLVLCPFPYLPGKNYSAVTKLADMTTSMREAMDKSIASSKSEVSNNL